MQEHRNVSPLRVRSGECFRMRDGCVLQDEFSGIQYEPPADRSLTVRKVPRTLRGRKAWVFLMVLNNIIK